MQIADSEISPPRIMRAAVYRGGGSVVVESVPVPEIGPGELLVRVEACGICHTDLKKIEYDLLAPPRIYGHETAGVVVAKGGGVERFGIGDRVIVFHHIPCTSCFYCARKLYAQCAQYKQVGVTAGFEPAGGGFAQYVRVMDWIVRRGVEKIPDGVSFDRAALIEPFHTVHKAVVQADPQPGETAVILGQGPIGLMFTMLVARAGCRILTTDTYESRRRLSAEVGADAVLHPLDGDVVAKSFALSGGRGADLVIVAASAAGIVEQGIRCSRPGSRILLFAQTSDRELVEVSGAAICKEERTLFGCYSASIDLQQASAGLIFRGEIPVERLVTDRIALDEIRAGIRLALRPNGQSLKIVVQPQRWTQ